VTGLARISARAEQLQKLADNAPPGLFAARVAVVELADAVQRLVAVVAASQAVVEMLERYYPELVADPDWKEIPALVAALAGLDEGA
jgi:hypothetical protein